MVLAAATELEACLHTTAHGSKNKYAAVFDAALTVLRRNPAGSMTAQEVAHAAVASAFAQPAMDTEFESRKAGKDDIACPKCGCKMVSYDVPYRGDEAVPTLFTCSNYVCAQES